MTYRVTAAQDPSRTGFAPSVSHSQQPAPSDAVPSRSGRDMGTAASPVAAEQGGGAARSDVVSHLPPETLPLETLSLETLSLETLSLAKRPAAVLRVAIRQFPASESWVDFYRELLGVEGVARRAFPTAEQMHFWERSSEFAEVLEMLTALRSTEVSKSGAVEPQRMITVRIPLSLHESLKQEAEDHCTSINKLCISKLLSGISSRFVPREKGKIRGRKPGPQVGRGKFAADAVAE
jgi:hypothetical protein